MIKNIILVGLGGMTGSILRYIFGNLATKLTINAIFPWSTFLINLTGCFLIGVISAGIEKYNIYNSEMKLLLLTGILGGFTTFSAYSAECLALMKSGNFGLGLLYGLTSLVLGILAVFLGMRIIS